VKLERRTLPGARESAARLVAGVLVAAVLLLLSRPQVTPIEMVGLQGARDVIAVLVAVIVLTVVYVQLEASSTSLRAGAWTVGLAYIVARVVAGLDSPVLSLSTWLTNGSTSHLDLLFRYTTAALFCVILLGLCLLIPLWPVVLHLDRRHRNLLALGFGLLPLAYWVRLDVALGTASAALVCALAVAVALWFATERAYVGAGVLVCAGFVAASVLVLEPAPSGVLGTSHYNAPNIDFRIRPPGRELLDTSFVSMFVRVEPQAATPLGCPSSARVHVFVASTGTGKAARRTSAMLRRSQYVLEVSGETTITNANEGTDGVSRVLRGSGVGEDSRTYWAATGLDTGVLGDSFDFDLPLQSTRSMGTCYLVMPSLQDSNDGPLPGFDGYYQAPWSGEVSLTPALGAEVDRSRTQPLPLGTDIDPQALRWQCYDTDARPPGLVAACPALVVTTTSWSDPYAQVSLILVGALVAIAAEQGLTRRRVLSD
jgi:hypothetical protein